MTTRSFTILETVLAAILAILIMIGSIGVIQNMGRETERLKTQIDQDTTWMSANIHLAKMVRSSSYLEIPNQNTLILRNYDNSEKGRYVYNANQRRLEYYINDGATLRESFNNVTVSFASLATTADPDKGTKDGKIIEVMINYTQPFENMLCLRCAVGVAPRDTWALVIDNVEQPYTYISCQQVFDSAGKPDGYIFAGSQHALVGGPFFIGKIDNYGNLLWLKRYFFTNPSGGSHFFYDLIQIKGSSPAPEAYVAVGVYARNLSAGSPTPFTLLARFNAAGDVEWVKAYRHNGPSEGLPNDWNPCCVRVYGASLNPDGFIIVGTNYAIAPGGSYPSNAYVIRTTNDGTRLWTRVLDTPILDAATAVRQVFSGNSPDGFIVAGYGYPSPMSPSERHLTLTRLNNDGTLRWSKMYKAGSSMMACRGRGFLRMQNPESYLLAGKWWGALCVKINGSGAVLWSKSYRYPTNPGPFVDVITELQDGGFLLGGPYAASRDVALNIDRDGNFREIRNYNPPGYYMGDLRTTVDENGEADGSIIAMQYGLFPQGFNGLYIIKTDLDGKCPAISNPVHITTIFPTPTMVDVTDVDSNFSYVATPDPVEVSFTPDSVEVPGP